jgi:pyruvate dehydrogenase E2 component (dihydrolipoamide acetyltransferase)
MPIEILLPALSPTMTTGNLTKWHKKEGDVVKAGQLLADVETDKATMEIEAVDDGILAKIIVAENTQNVAINTVIAVLAQKGEDINLAANYSGKPLAVQILAAPLESVAESKPDVVVASFVAAPDTGKIFASPLAKRIAEQMGVDLTKIVGSGPQSRIIKADVLSAKASVKTAEPISSGHYTLEPVTAMRKIIASRLLESKQTVPHFYLSIDCQLDNLIALRQQINETAAQKISINDFIIKAAALSMKKMPEVNSSWAQDGIRRYSNVDIAVAVSVEGGLVTPIVASADGKTLSQISATMKDLVVRAKANKLKPEEFQGGGFTISNLGMFGIKNFCAIINPPQSCILAVGATEQKPVARDGQIVIATVMNITLSCDHRVVDGVVGANFLQTFKGFLQNPIQMLV